MVTCIRINMVGLMWILDIPLNAISLVNLVVVSFTCKQQQQHKFPLIYSDWNELLQIGFSFFYQCVGFGVEFVSHIVRAYCNASGKNEDRTSEAITKLGASVFSGITITKILGISVLAFSKSQVNIIK